MIKIENFIQTLQQDVDTIKNFVKQPKVKENQEKVTYVACRILALLGLGWMGKQSLEVAVTIINPLSKLAVYLGISILCRDLFAISRNFENVDTRGPKIGLIDQSVLLFKSVFSTEKKVTEHVENIIWQNLFENTVSKRIYDKVKTLNKA